MLLSATEAVRLLRRGEITPLDLIDAAAERIARVEPQVNALPIRFLDSARDRARQLRPATQRKDPPPGWLAGLPIIAKDYNDVGGQRTTYGSPIFANSVASANDFTVAALEDSGGIFIAKSNVPEFAGANTFNPVFGATRNPWNLGMSAGGSSGWRRRGACFGHRMAGNGQRSRRQPADSRELLWSGRDAAEPGRVPRGANLPPFDTLWVEGPMGRNVADVALMLDAQAVQHPHDPLSLPPPREPSPMRCSARVPRPASLSVPISVSDASIGK